MKQIDRKDLLLLAAQLLLMSLIVASPGVITYLTTDDAAATWQSLTVAAYWLAPSAVVYLLNFYFVVPRCWFGGRRAWFVVLNVALLVMANMHVVTTDVQGLNGYMRAGYYTFAIVALLINMLAISIALSLRYMMLMNERRQKEVEAELTWLKNQINPHFLFNTLNNISSLTQINADHAQDAIAQLSDLLRYAMYETNKKTVPLGGEVAFMSNYIELMRLRCNALTTVSFDARIADEQLHVAPLLFISLVENAFKHGIDNTRPAHISISIAADADGRLTFSCDNTNNPKPTTDRSGSGIGVENTRRRMELMYAGRYDWQQTITPDNTYHVTITLQLK